MKKEILSEELNAMKYLLGYKRGVVISEQQAPQLGSIQPSNQSTANMFKDSLAATNQIVANNSFAPKTQSPAPATAAPVTPAPATPAPATAAPAPVTAAPAPVTAAPAPPATNLSMPELIKKIQTILITKFSATLGTSGPNKDGIDGVWGKNSQAAFENALKTLSTKAATTPAGTTTTAPAGTTTTVPAGTTTTAPAGTTTTAPAYNFNVDPNLGKGGIGFNRMTPEQLVQGVQSATPPKLPTRDESIAKAKADLKAARGMK